jgi:hypothetical protein
VKLTTFPTSAEVKKNVALMASWLSVLLVKQKENFTLLTPLKSIPRRHNLLL